MGSTLDARETGAPVITRVREQPWLAARAPRLDRVVVGVDFGAPSVAAVDWVARHVAPDAEVILVHVVAAPAPTYWRGAHDPLLGVVREDAERRLRELRRSLGADPCRCEVRAGDPAHCLADVASAYGADLIVVGAHGESPERPSESETTAERLVRCAPVPVLVAAGALAGPPRAVLVPAVRGDLTPTAVAWSRFVAERFDAKVAGIDIEPPATGAAADACGVIERAARSTRWRTLADAPRCIPLFCDALSGEAATVVLAQARRFRSDLVVLDAAAAGECTLTDVLRRARCSVLVVGGVP